QHAEREAERRAAQRRLPRAAPIVAAHAHEALELHGRGLVAAARSGLMQRLADGEEPDDENDDVDADEQLRDAEREPSLARELVDADEPECQSHEEAEDAAR